MTTEYTKHEWDDLQDKVYNLPQLANIPKLTDPIPAGTAARISVLNMAMETARNAINWQFRDNPNQNPLIVVTHEHGRMLRAIQLANEQARYTTLETEEEEF